MYPYYAANMVLIINMPIWIAGAGILKLCEAH
jgi:hypothetical protein